MYQIPYTVPASDILSDNNVDSVHILHGAQRRYGYGTPLKWISSVTCWKEHRRYAPGGIGFSGTFLID